MPTYDYECERGHRFEAFQSMKDEPLSSCRECGAPAKRLIGPGAGFLFRGDGFYITDYRSKGYKEKAKAETAPKSEGAAGGAKSDAGAGKSDGGASKSDTGGSPGTSANPGKSKDQGKGS